MTTTYKTKCANCTEKCKDRKAAAEPVNNFEKLAKMSAREIETITGGD
jgi:hypothetical protein